MNNYQELKKIKLRIKGMSSKSSEDLIVQKFKQIEGIERAYAHWKEGKAEIYCWREPNIQQLQDDIVDHDFTVNLWAERENNTQEPTSRDSRKEYIKIAGLILFSAGAYFIFKQFNFVPQVQNLASTNLWIIFLTGLTVGGLSCLAVQGGLLASTIAQREEEEIEEGRNRKNNLLPVAVFLGSKLVAYTILGFLLGAFGKALSITGAMQTNMQLIAGLYMILVALNLLNIHPIFRYAIIQPPRFLTRIVRNQSKSKDLFAPGLLGLMTIFIPCGTTLAMEALAISSANPILGASTMAVFTIGTMPLFFGLGFLTTTLGDVFKSKFLKLAAIAVLYLGLSSVNGSLLASGSPLTFQSVTQKLPTFSSDKAKNDPSAEIKNGAQAVEIKVQPNGYSPSYIKVKSGQPVALYLTTSDKLGCTAVFRIPSLGIVKSLTPAFTDASIKFTPQKPGSITFTCSMGMYSGVIEAT